MFPWLRSVFHRHPLLRDALLWALPAIVFGAVLRSLLLSYLPYAYWGSDSRSYFGFTEQLLDSGRISLYDKRRYLYPLGLLPITLLPGSPLQWLAWVQHGLGLATLVPLAYIIRRVFRGWRLWIVPLTVVYAGLPITLWYEHELLGETLFFNGVVWMSAGWVAFAAQTVPARAAARFWWFLAGLAVVILTKPAGRFFWPVILLALLLFAAWRIVRWPQWIGLGTLFALTFTIGQETQGAWLLYASAFPLTRLESPLHAEYKTEVAGLVRSARAQLETSDRGPDSKLWMDFLKWPERQSERPLWTALGEDDTKKQRIYKELAIEGIKAHPLLFLKIAVGKIIASANPGDFKASRFLPHYYVEKYAHQYESDVVRKPDRVRRLFGLRRDFVFPSYTEFARRLAPHPESKAALWLHRYVAQYHRAAHFVRSDDEDDPDVELTPLAWWVLAGALLALLPPTFRTLGITTLFGVSYLFGVFLVGGINPRYFAAVWPIALLALAVPLDLLARLALNRRTAR